jgi:cell division protein FtsL
MRWLLPFTLVLLVALLLAAAHYLFMRWMTRQSATAREPDPVDRSEGNQLKK